MKTNIYSVLFIYTHLHGITGLMQPTVVK